ncbi:hypothetical protein [Sulfurimonas sp.]|uniref:hypothetical protein n=1 Tax=Sulfurimonas sp. TaxID=2022749 RepID=UPI003567F859
MKKILFLSLIFINLAFGYNYDDLLLKAQASIFPKIITLDKKIDEKLIDGKIVYTIIYDKTDYVTAKSIKEFINSNFQGRLDTYDYKINLVDFSNFSEQTEASAIYVLNLQDHIEDIANIANFKGIISFSYDINNLNKGLMFSLVIEKSTVIYLKKENLYTNKIEFVDALLQMVRFIENDYAYKRDKLFQKKMHYNSVSLKNIYANITNDMLGSYK